jgi:8-oxo-dGTP diphosphatase
MISVTCAIIRNEEDEILVVQRGEATDHPLKWEFPGGKLNQGESDEDCIIREVEEELSMEIVIVGKLSPVDFDYGHKKIRLIPFICDTLDEVPFLTEHVAFKWLENKDLMTVDFSGADVLVAQNYLEKTGSGDISQKEVSPNTENSSDVDTDLQKIVNNMMGMKEAEWVAMSAIENPAIFVKLFEYSNSSDKNLSFRASWTLTKVCDKFPEIIYPYLPQIVETLSKIESESTLRSFLRILSFTDLTRINNRQQGTLADFCFDKLNSGFSAIAVKAYSLEIIYKLALIYPEFANELAATINMLQEDGSAGMVARGRLVMKKLAEIPIKPKSSQK